MNIQQIEDDIVAAFKTPQAAVSSLITAVTILGTVGILNADWTGALKTLLAAMLGVLALGTHTAVSVRLARSAARKAAGKVAARAAG